MCGLDAALIRLGTLAPISHPDLGSIHGILMVHGFLGTAICLERAVSLQAGVGGGITAQNTDVNSGAISGKVGTRWAYIAPFFAGAGAIAAVIVALNPVIRDTLSALPIPSFLAATLPGFQPARMLPGFLWTLSMAALCAIYAVIWRGRQQSIALLVQGLGAVVGVCGTLLWWRGLEVAVIVPWWLMFLVLTIMGERLELARIQFMSGSVELRILGESSALVIGLLLTLLSPPFGYPILGLALAALVIDVAIHDVARNTARLSGLPRLAGWAMLLGHGWALIPAVMWVIAPPQFSGWGYDAGIHALSIGFVMSMVVAHAPVIIPAVARRELPYHRAMWVVLILFHLALFTRIIGDVRADTGIWQLGGALGVATFLVFIGLNLGLAIHQARVTRKATATATPSTGQDTSPTPSSSPHVAASEAASPTKGQA